MADGVPLPQSTNPVAARRTVNHGRERLGGPVHQERHMKIICVGAGASGLCFAYKLQRDFDNFTLTLYEKNKGVSGTWIENRYPGCACDVPAHNYTWSFEPKTNWSAVYAKSGEIYEYFNDFADKYSLHQYIRCNHRVDSAVWNDDKGYWNVEVIDVTTGERFHDSCDILINSGGILNAWRWPAIPGLQNYKGKLMHSANWDNSVDLKDKNVGLIGNGSSGIQILPAIHPIVKTITTFIREPTWVSPVQGMEQYVYTEAEKEEFARHPAVLTELRKANESGLNGLFSLFLKNTQFQADTKTQMTEQMRAKLQNAYLEEKLIPNWGVGCRRLTPGINYLETLGKENVQVVYGEIEAITERGCKCSDGKEYPVDILICATGFDTSFRPRFPVVGFAGKNLQDEWAQEPKSYLGMAASGIPNYMIFLGPNCPIGNGPLLSAIECQADYMLKLCDRWQTENIHSFDPKMEAVQDYIDHTDQFMKRTIWGDNCRSWYKNNSASGRISALWPGSTLHFLECMSYVRHDDWNITYNGNRFSWMGNGYGQTEMDTTSDWGYYIRERDDAPPITKSKLRKILTKSGSRKEGETFNNPVAPLPAKL